MHPIGPAQAPARGEDALWSKAANRTLPSDGRICPARDQPTNAHRTISGAATQHGRQPALSGGSIVVQTARYIRYVYPHGAPATLSRTPQSARKPAEMPVYLDIGRNVAERRCLTRTVAQKSAVRIERISRQVRALLSREEHCQGSDVLVG